MKVGMCGVMASLLFTYSTSVYEVFMKGCFCVVSDMFQICCF